MQSIRVNSWNELQDELFKESWSHSIHRYRSHEAYRGLSSSEYILDTSLSRLGGDYAKLERHLLRNFRKYAHRKVVEKDSLWHWLSLAQHHGLPTRLLDWTYSPFVAMHFATADLEKFDKDGVIIAVDYVKTHQLLPRKLKIVLEKEGANVFSVDMLNQAVESLSDLDSLSHEEFAIFMEPPSMDDRIVNQYAFFSVMSKAKGHLDKFLSAHPELGRRIIIPAELKWEIRDKLDQANITERVLFPGLDGLSSWLKRQYSPSGPRNRE